MEEPKKTKFLQQAEMLIAKIEAGTAPWQKPWRGSTAEIPMNPATGNQYKGFNAINLMMAGESDPRWMTYKQAQSVGAQVRSGERGESVLYWVFEERQEVRDDQGNPVIDENGKVKKETVKLIHPKVIWSTVFNASQIDGLPPLPVIEQTEEQKWNALERAEQAMQLSGVTILERDNSNQAFYSSINDQITLPARQQFLTREGFYQVALHELGHATGHESRLNRELGNSFGSEKYAREELVAEITSMFVGMRTGIGSTPSDGCATYIASWVKAIKNDPKAILKAASDAEKACEYIMKPVRQHELENGIHYDEESNVYAFGNELNTATSVIVDLNERMYIDVPYKEKNQVKELGGKWDKVAQSWYIPDGMDPEKFKQWPFKDLAQVVEHKVSTPEERPVITPENERIYIDVAYKDKDLVRAAGGKWDRAVQAWYIPNDAQKEKFSQWNEIEKPPVKDPRHYISVPYDDRVAAKDLGAKWDKGAKSWYIPEGVDQKPFVKWEISERNIEATPVLSPKEEFAVFLKGQGCIFDACEPYMDGPNKHRIAVEGDKGNEKSGFYVGFEDGHPAGYFKNNRTGEEIKWKSQGQYLTTEQKQTSIAQSTEKKKIRDEESQKKQSSALKALNGVLEHSQPINSVSVNPESYIERKGIESNFRHGVFLTSNKDLCVPGINISGELQTAQYIKDDGSKLFAKFCPTGGAFHVVNTEQGKEFDALYKCDIIVVSEGYATAASIQTVQEYIKDYNIQTVAAFSANNLQKVVLDLEEKYPHKPILIAGDDDYTAKVNVGKTKAMEAGADSNSKVAVIFPKFTETELAKANGKGFSDFNDVLLKTENGKVNLANQIDKGIIQAITRCDQIVQKHQKETIVQSQELSEQQEVKKSRSR